MPAVLPVCHSVTLNQWSFVGCSVRSRTEMCAVLTSRGTAEGHSINAQAQDTSEAVALGCTDFPKLQAIPKISRRHRTKFGRHGDVASVIFASLR